ncbi:MAG: RES family NAD+ phosphorylase [Thermoanaerobaculia bacterium]
MTRVFWRLSVARDVALAFRGTRARGRWNTAVTHPVYAAGSVALAALERLLYAQFSLGDDAFQPHHLFRIVVPDRLSVEYVSRDQLPEDWHAMAAPPDPLSPPTPLQRIGDAWFTGRSTVALIVPSAHAWEETNVLLNPEHPEFRELEIGYVRPYRFDRRHYRP